MMKKTHHAQSMPALDARPHANDAEARGMVDDGTVAGTYSPPSFELVYRESFTSVYRVCLLTCKDHSIAEDATQEAFARALERWSRLQDKDWLVGWIARTAMNFARRSMRRLPQEDQDVSMILNVDFQIDLWRAISALPRRQQEAFVLYYILDCPVSSVARAMRVKEGTAKAHLARGRAAMKQLMEGDADE